MPMLLRSLVSGLHDFTVSLDVVASGSAPYLDVIDRFWTTSPRHSDSPTPLYRLFYFLDLLGTTTNDISPTSLERVRQCSYPAVPRQLDMAELGIDHLHRYPSSQQANPILRNAFGRIVPVARLTWKSTARPIASLGLQELRRTCSKAVP